MPLGVLEGTRFKVLAAWSVLVFTAIASIVGGVVFSVHHDEDTAIVWLVVLGVCVVVGCAMAFLIEARRPKVELGQTR